MVQQKMAVDCTSFVVLPQPSLNITEPIEIILKVLLCGGLRVLIVSNGKKDEVILVQFTEVHALAGLR